MDWDKEGTKEIRGQWMQTLCPPSLNATTVPRGVQLSPGTGRSPARPPPQLAESILTASSPSCGALCLTLTPSQPAVSVHHSHSETCLSMCLPPLPT